MHQPMSKTQPGKPGGHKAQYNGDGHDFNEKAKVTSPGSSYHGYGEGFNSTDKDASLDYMKSRNKQGIEVRDYSGTHDHKREKTKNVGATAYNSNPIAQTYSPATSNGAPDQDQVVYQTKTKDVLKG